MHTVESLRKNGFRVRVRHDRAVKLAPESTYSKYDVFSPNDFPYIMYGELSPRGGHTTVEITQGEKSFMGESHCSLQDHFCRRTGVKIALERAIEKAQKHGLALPQEETDVARS